MQLFVLNLISMACSYSALSSFRTHFTIYLRTKLLASCSERVDVIEVEKVMFDLIIAFILTHKNVPERSLTLTRVLSNSRPPASVPAQNVFT